LQQKLIAFLLVQGEQAHCGPQEITPAVDDQA
jgi:hypothetical protein